MMKKLLLGVFITFLSFMDLYPKATHTTVDYVAAWYVPKTLSLLLGELTHAWQQQSFSSAKEFAKNLVNPFAFGPKIQPKPHAAAVPFVGAALAGLITQKQADFRSATKKESTIQKEDIFVGATLAGLIRNASLIPLPLLANNVVQYLYTNPQQCMHELKKLSVPRRASILMLPLCATSYAGSILQKRISH